MEARSYQTCTPEAYLEAETEHGMELTLAESYEGIQFGESIQPPE